MKTKLKGFVISNKEKTRLLDGKFYFYENDAIQDRLALDSDLREYWIIYSATITVNHPVNYSTRKG